MRQAREGGAEVGVGIVPEFLNERMTFERRLDDAALHAAPSAMHQPHDVDAGVRGRVYVFRDDGWDLARRKRMKIKFALDRNPDWLTIHGVPEA